MGSEGFQKELETCPKRNFSIQWDDGPFGLPKDKSRRGSHLSGRPTCGTTGNARVGLVPQVRAGKVLQVTGIYG